MALKTVIVELAADTRKLQSGFQRANKETATLTRSILRFGAAFGGAFSARALARAFQGTILDAKELIDTAKGVGVATQEYERLAFVLKQLGAAPQSLRQGFGDLQLRLGDVGKIYDKYFKMIGLDPNKLRKESPSDQLEQTLKALARVEVQGRRAALAGRVLGEESSRQLLKVVNSGIDEIERVSETFVSTLEPGQEKAVDKYVEKLGELEQAWKRVKTQVALSVLTDENIDKIDAFTKELQESLKTVDLLKAGAPVLAAAFIVAFGAMAAAIGPVGVALAGIAAGLTSIVVNWDDLMRSLSWVREKAGEKVKDFAESIYGIANPWAVRAPQPPVMLARPELAGQPGFSKTIAPGVVNQYFSVQGMTPEQMAAYGRRQASKTQRGEQR